MSEIMDLQPMTIGSCDKNKKYVIGYLNQMAEENSLSDELLEKIRGRLLELPPYYYIFTKISKCLGTKRERTISLIALEVLLMLDEENKC